MARDKLKIPYKCGTKEYQRCRAVCAAHGSIEGSRPYDQLPEVVKQTLEKELSSSTSTSTTVMDEEESKRRWVEACEEVGWQMANLTKAINKFCDTMKEMENASKQA
jgi:hypothetical protein